MRCNTNAFRAFSRSFRFVGEIYDDTILRVVFAKLMGSIYNYLDRRFRIFYRVPVPTEDAYSEQEGLP